ncbi:hypothetical protein K1719_042507 [Acacia pycnantha]|nr:hypothetical protein K1719_042507 [Acacia pycnantha]
MNSDVLFLPHEIIRNILKRLPSTHQNPSLLLECNGINIPLHWRLNLLDCGLQVPGVQNSPSNNSLRNAGIVGSCNGLVCLEIHQFNKRPHSLSLWNPATTAVRYVPRTRTGISYFDDCVTGFGFSSIVNDYQIVRTYAEFYDVVTKVEVFSLNRMTWKLVGEKKEGEDNIDFQEDVFYVEEVEDRVNVIVSFDIAKEVFTVIPWPEVDGDAEMRVHVHLGRHGAGLKDILAAPFHIR